MISRARAWSIHKPARIAVALAGLLIGAALAPANGQTAAPAPSAISTIERGATASYIARDTSAYQASRSTPWIDYGIGDSRGGWRAAKSANIDHASGLLWTLRGEDTDPAPLIAASRRSGAERDTIASSRRDSTWDNTTSFLIGLLELMAFIVWIYSGLLLVSHCQTDGLDARYS